ncbi:MAG: calcium-binding protein [Solirubrobacteraceae bacterium]
MSGARQTNHDLDELIGEITVDCYDEDEQLQGFENAFDEDASFPLSGTVVGEHVEIVQIRQGDGRRELIATCERAGHRYEVALLDIADIAADSQTMRLVAAYRHWIRA